MPKRTDIKKILIIGSGPIIIGQACEFDYSGTQACKALREEGYEVVLLNSNPATIMTDPGMADRTYIEPITPEVVDRILEKEKPQACLTTMGGQTGLNVTVKAAEKGIFKKHGVELIGAKLDAIKKAEDRSQFKKAMNNIGLDLPRSEFAYSVQEALEVAEKIGYPVIVRPSYTLGGSGSGICYNKEELEQTSQLGLEYSIINEVLIEESVLGWKEFEYEVMRDVKDNVVIICTIENFDPMGTHTGDSITVAPAQTLTDKEYQRMRDASIKVIREIGVDTGGSNIQYAVNPKDGRMVVIEMNPRVSRSSALASKATGFPIAKFAAKLAVGMTLDEISNDITKYTPASFEPTIDYCVVKIPRFAFEKFPGVNSNLTSQMKSVGEAMAIGRTFKEAMQKGLRSLETRRAGFGGDGRDKIFDEELYDKKSLLAFLQVAPTREDLKTKIKEYITTGKADRIFYLKYAFYVGLSVDEVAHVTGIDPWFLVQLKQLVDFEQELLQAKGAERKALLREAKQLGFSDYQLAFYWDSKESDVRKMRKQEGVVATYKLVDTCAAEFKAYTPYFYSTYEDEDETIASDKRKIMILGGGPNRIGQGIEFDYCCVQAAYALKSLGFETIMVNSNPETVSTDYDTSDKLFFEPLTIEDVLNIADRENPEGVIVQLGGQTPLNLAKALEENGLNIIGTSASSIDDAEDRDKFQKLLKKSNLHQAPGGIATNADQAIKIAEELGYPVLVRPSYVLGGRGMEIVYDHETMRSFSKEALDVAAGHPILIDKFLDEAKEVDVDCISDGEIQVVGAVMEHIEEAGIHSGDSASVIPPFTLKPAIIEEIIQKTKLIARELKVIGLMNVQYAIKDNQVYCLEVNPRASRTVPFVSKTIGVSLAWLAAQIMVGKKLKELNFTEEIVPKYYSVKESVLPFVKFPGVDTVLSPEMRSTGEVMGIDKKFGSAYFKSQEGAWNSLPHSGRIFVSVRDADKTRTINIVRELIEMGYQIISTSGTQEALAKAGMEVEGVLKISEGRPNVSDKIKNGDIQFLINTPSGRRGPLQDEGKIRSLAVQHGLPYITTISAASAAVRGLKAVKEEGIQIQAIQDYHKTLKQGSKINT